jgi:lysophospholipase L1-like esterase
MALSLSAALVAPPRAGAEPAGAPIAPGARPTPPTHRYLVAAVGDSLTDERSGGGRYLLALRERCPKSRFVSFGKGGEMVNQMRARLEGRVFAGGDAYTHVVFFGGVNDLYSDVTAGRTPAKIEADLAAMYAAARRRGASVVAITVAPWGGFKRYFNPRRGAATLEVNRWIAAQRGVTVDHVVDAFGLLSCAGAEPSRLCKPLGQKDGLHLSAEGHARLGEALHRQVFRDCE